MISIPALLDKTETQNQLVCKLVQLMVLCPTTYRPTYTGFSISPHMLAEMELSHQLFLCQECKHPHVWSRQDILFDMLETA